MKALDVSNIVRYAGIVGGIYLVGAEGEHVLIKLFLAGSLGGTAAVGIYNKIQSKGAIKIRDEFSQDFTPSAFGTAGYILGATMNIPYGQYIGMIAGTYLSTANSG